LAPSHDTPSFSRSPEQRGTFRKWKEAGSVPPAPNDDGCTLSLNIFDKRNGFFVNCNVGDSRAALYDMRPKQATSTTTFASLDHHASMTFLPCFPSSSPLLFISSSSFVSPHLSAYDVVNVLGAGGIFTGPEGAVHIPARNGNKKSSRMQPRYHTNPYNIPMYSLYLGAALGDLLFKLRGPEKRDLVLTGGDIKLNDGFFLPLSPDFGGIVPTSP